MADFEVELSFEKFRMVIKGNREDVPVITSNLRQQIAGMLQPAANIVEGAPGQRQIENFVAPANGTSTSPRAARRPRRSKVVTSTDGQPATPTLNWKHDPGKWGIPKQSFRVGEKIVWLLYVVAQELKMTSLTGRQISDTFNAHFKQANTLNGKNTVRDLGLLKQRVPALVGEDSSVVPSSWFLTEEGNKEGVRLVALAKGLGPQVAQPTLIPDGD